MFVNVLHGHTNTNRLSLVESGNFEIGHSVDKAIERFWMSFAGYMCSLCFVRVVSEIPGLIFISTEYINLQSRTALVHDSEFSVRTVPLQDVVDLNHTDS